MSTDHNIMRLPDPPPPAPDARASAVQEALLRFDQKSAEEKNADDSQGMPTDVRLIERTAASLRPSRERFVMKRTRYLLAASLACIVAGSGAYLHLMQSPQSQDVAAPVEQKVASNDVAQAPSTVQAKKESESQAQPQTQIQAVAPSVAAAPPPAEPHVENLMASRDAPKAPPATASRAPMQVAPSEKYALRGRTDHTLSRAPSAPLLSQVEVFRDQRERVPAASEPVGRDKFANAPENAFKVARDAPVSTFSIDVDTASYAFVRAQLNRNVLPPAASVRTEELINYFPYAYEAPASASEPFRANVAVFPNPWAEGRKLIRIGVKGYALQQTNRPRANLVFLIDTSGSMAPQNRLPLVKQSLAMLVTQLKPEDRIAIVTYAGNAGTALEPTSVSEKAKILGTIDRLEAGGSTAGAEGIRQAYALAEQNFDASGVNRVILATDGDFNVGITNKDELKGFVERQREQGIFLSVLGVGAGNYNDALAQTLAQNGNGVAAYIDTINEARKVLVEEASSTLFPIGKDVKIQVEFNPASVAEYRLIGYETRLLNRDDFSNDKVDAGDVGSGQTVTALYDIVPVGGPRVVDDLRYGAQAPASDSPAPAEYAFVKIRYKLPRSDQSVLVSTPVDRASEHGRFEDAPLDARFATSVAAFGEILRGGKHTGRFGYDDVLRIASAARGDDLYGYRSEFLQLVRAAKTASAMQPLRP
ncbi:VWA domain-containing protein [Bradyrhizobium japonicum]|nr:VWA domain-containing protein [Bradyrhizobium japonicum]MCD9822397.1 VWA domain-containing protein [Bradyrhizobium japonicum]MCD9894803.1 VWA domain-containing protein [Bradyrhizobium japonicum]MEB2674048.1 VWA domain-containing protein [Bradyrhizobium japonicum]WLB32583.1 VWA domain-containing protein [Bradyrhizobium japonicum]WRI93234.1 VWA domain-containing protein [Bradyrhizobium japonicum]